MAAANVGAQHQAATNQSVQNVTMAADSLNVSTGGQLGNAYGEAVALTVTALYNGVAEFSFKNPQWTDPQTVFLLVQLLLGVYMLRLAIVPVAVIVTGVLELYRQQKRGGSTG